MDGMEASGGGLQPGSSSAEIQVVPGAAWWWAGWSVLSALALALNILFLVIVVQNRKTRDFRSLLTAVLVTITVLDILDLGRIAPSLVSTLHQYSEFRLVYCTVGVFHTVGVSLLLVLTGLYLVCPCRDAPPLYYPAQSCSGSLPQKLLVPLALLLAAAAAALVPLLPAITASIVDQHAMVPHSCIDPTRLVHLVETGGEGEGFWVDIYQAVVGGLGVGLPLLILPPAVLMGATKACIYGHCCQIKFKQSAGELLLVTLVTVFYLGSVVGSLLPHLDQQLELGLAGLHSPVTVLWEIANAAARPAIYFLASPAAWEGLKHVCCSSSRSYGSVSTKEDEVALSPVVERISSL